MGLFDFGPKRPYHRVTVKEYQEKVLPQLRNLNFHGTDLGIIEGLVTGNMDEGSHVREGVDEKEFAAMLTWLETHQSRHSLSEHQIEQFGTIMRKYLEKSS